MPLTQHAPFGATVGGRHGRRRRVQSAFFGAARLRAHAFPSLPPECFTGKGCESSRMTRPAHCPSGIWDIAGDGPSGRCVRSLAGHAGPIVSIEADRDRILSTSFDGTLRVWQWDGIQVRGDEAPHSVSPACIAVETAPHYIGQSDPSRTNIDEVTSVLHRPRYAPIDSLLCTHRLTAPSRPLTPRYAPIAPALCTHRLPAPFRPLTPRLFPTLGADDRCARGPLLWSGHHARERGRCSRRCDGGARRFGQAVGRHYQLMRGAPPWVRTGGVLDERGSWARTNRRERARARGTPCLMVASSQDDCDDDV